MSTQTLSYAIDEHDHLIRVDEGYYAFAAENGWEEATTSLGRSLWDYVAGQEMVKLQRLRTTEASAYTKRDTPTFTCVATSVERALAALDGAPLADALSVS